MTKWYDKRGHPVATCKGCLAWGHIFARGLCAACYLIDWKETWPRGICRVCRYRTRVKDRRCRLCWENARILAHNTGDRTIFPIDMLDEVRQPQLFLANTGNYSAKGTPRRGLLSRAKQKQRARGELEQPRDLPKSVKWQLPLFRLKAGTADLHPGQPYNERRMPVAVVQQAWAVLQRISESHGWSYDSYIRARRALTLVLDGHVDGEQILHSRIATLVTPGRLSTAKVVEVVSEMGIYRDDRTPSFELSLATRLNDLAPGIAEELKTWAGLMIAGTARRTPRSPRTVLRYLDAIRPTLLSWSRQYEHLREITRDDLLAAIDMVTGYQRETMIIGFRALFLFAKQAGIVFQNPASRIRAGGKSGKVLQPLTTEAFREVVEAALRPADPLIICLASIHAAPASAIRRLQLDDVDLGNRRITLADRVQPLDELTYNALRHWLDYRNATWPTCPNPHLLITRQTASTTASVGTTWLGRTTRGLDATLERLRINRRLDEALTHGADALHLTAVFGIANKTALRYVDSARQLLATSVESGTVESSRTYDSSPGPGGNGPLGSP